MTTMRATSTTGSARSILVDSTDEATAALIEAWHWPYVRQGFIAMVLIALGAFSPAFVADDSPLYTVGFLGIMLSEPARLASTAVMLVGVLQLFDAWVRLRPAAGVPTAPVATLAWWSLPVLFAPPLFSRDAFSYAAQGLVVSRGMDPYATGPIAVPGPFADQVDQLWLYTPAPYGPIALQVQRMIVEAVGGHALPAAIAMRVPALAAVAAIAWALPRLAERIGVSRDQAVWLGVINPLVLMHFVSGMHNDAMMVALIVVGMLLATDGRLVAAAALVATGATFKQTAVLALAGVAGAVYRHRAGVTGEAPLRSRVDMRAFVVIAIKVGLVALATFTVLTSVSGLGWGWIHNLGVPGSVVSLLSPVTVASIWVATVLHWFGMPETWTVVVGPIFHKLGTLGTLVGLGWVTFVLAPRRPVAAAAWGLMAFVLGSPTVYAWYLLWGFVLFGATRLDRRLVAAVVLVTGWFVGYTMIDMSVANGAAMLGVAGAGWGALTLYRRRDALLTPLPTVPDGAPAVGRPVEMQPAA